MKAVHGCKHRRLLCHQARYQFIGLMNRIRTAGSAREQVTAGIVDELLDGSIGGSEMAHENALMILGPPLEHRGDECNAEAAAPVPAEVHQARASVVLVLGQIGVCELSYWNEHECIAEALVSTREREMKIVSLRSQPAIVEHRERRDSKTRSQKTLCTDPRNDANHKRSQDRDHRGARAEDQSCVSRRVAEERLKNLGDQHRAAEHAEPKQKIVDARDPKVPLAQESQFNDRILMMPLPPDRKCYGNYRDNEKSRDEVAPKPVVALSPVQHNFEARKSNRDQSDSNAVDPKLATPP